MSDNKRSRLVEDWNRFAAEDLAAAKDLQGRGILIEPSGAWEK